MTRVLDITQWYAPTSGGIRTYLEQKSRYASAHVLDHAVVVTGRGTRSRMLHGSPMLEVPAVPLDPRSGYRLAVRPRAVLEILRATRPGIVVLHDATAFPVAVRRWASATGGKVVMVIHSELEAGADGLPGPFRRPARAMLARVQDRGLSTPDLIIATSPSLRDRIMARGVERPEVIPLGVDHDVFLAARPDPVLRRRLAPDDVPLLVHAGRLSPEKHVVLLPDVLVAMDQPAIMAIAGSGPSAAALRRRAIRLGVGDRMRMLGHIPDRHALATLLATADCFVHTNPDEVYGLAPLEALAAGTRVVAPRGGGLKDVLADRGAVLVDPDGAASLARGVTVALGSPRPVAPLDDLTWERTFDREWDLYEALAGSAAA